MRVAILTYNSCALFELGCATELFALPRPEFKHWYQTDIVCFDSGPYSSVAGLQLFPKQISSLQDYDMLVVPSWPTNISRVQGLIADEIRRFHQQQKRIISFCSGSFLLASLGILDGRTATTHWRYAAKFQQRYPRVKYIDNILYVFEGTLGCSAGSAAALDLGLEVIRIDFGHEAANQVARRLVVSAHRKGGQSQYVDLSSQRPIDHFSGAIDWALNNLARRFTVDALAERANMSRRSFDRHFRRVYNQTPKQWLIQQRLERAKQLLESSSAQIEGIAQSAGFDNAVESVSLVLTVKLFS